MKKFNVLFLSENMAEGGHGFDIWEGMKEHCNFFEVVDFTKEYESLGKSKFETKILQIIQQKKIDYLYIAQGTSFIIDLKFLKHTNTFCKLVLMLPDTEHNFEVDRYYAQAADLVWLLGPAGVALYELYNIPCMWTQGFDTKRYYFTERERDIDVSFIGGIDRGNRKDYVSFLEQNNIHVELYGYGTKNGMISNEQKNEIVWRSKINLNFTGVENKEKNIFKRLLQAKGRPMEIAISGGFVLSEHAPQIDKMFDIPNEIDVFRTKEELLEKINYYLKNEQEREKKREKAYRKALARYETKNSFKDILSKLDKIEYSDKTYNLDKDFVKRFISVRFYYLAKFFCKFKFNAAMDELYTIFSYSSLTLRNLYFDIPRGIYHALRGR